MTGVETVGRIRFEHFQNGKGIKRIARELGIARDTVRKVLRSGATEFVYRREDQPQRIGSLDRDADGDSRGRRQASAARAALDGPPVRGASRPRLRRRA